METTSTPQQTSEKSVVIVNCPIDDYGEYIVSASSISAKSDLFLPFTSSIIQVPKNL